MAKCILKPNADAQQVRREMKRRGYILRTYQRPDGTVKYTLRKNTYNQPKNDNENI